MVSRLHYISQEVGDKGHIENIIEACKAGVDWVQLRVKDASEDDLLALAYEAKAVCKENGAKLIINDHVEIAKQVKAHGVHLGLQDMKPSEARSILGEKPYIGATANTWDDVQSLCNEPIDYIGLGPFKHTVTKEKLSPILGIKGYSNILNHMIIEDIEMPIIAIGGIEIEDIFDIQMSGCYGIAVASLINHSNNKKETIENINLSLLHDEF